MTSSTEPRGLHLRIRRALAPVLLLALLLGSIAPVIAQESQPLPSYVVLGEGETLAERQEITIGVNRNLVNGQEDFWYVHASLQVWQPLIRYNNEFQLEPGLAERWELSADGLSSRSRCCSRSWASPTRRCP